MVLAGFVTAWRLASWPTSRSPVLVNATTEGTVRPPSAEAMTVGSPPSMTATTLFVVPRSIPMIFPMFAVSPVRSVGSYAPQRVSALNSVDATGVGRWRVGRLRLSGNRYERGPDDPIAE